mmetsp:Transcript_10003/g.10101  ORF Transcript_10003/g.10101 Transcript_10003/m.10101 type:complete len:93 (-) Transcript_10003:474-752(-)
MSSEPKNKKKKSPAPPTPPATSTFSSASPLLTSSSPSNTSNLASSLMTASMIAAQSDFTAYKSPAVAKNSIEHIVKCKIIMSFLPQQLPKIM